MYQQTNQFGKWEITTTLSHLIASDVPRLEQVHGGRIVEIGEAKQGVCEADGFLLREKNDEAAIKTGDCMPLVLMGQDEALALHVSRKTLIAGQLESVRKYFGPGEINHAWIGPHICAKHFVFEHFGDDLKKLQEYFPEAVREDKEIHVDILKPMKDFIEDMGVTEDDISTSDICTYEDERFPSYRRSLSGHACPGTWIATVVRKYP